MATDDGPVEVGNDVQSGLARAKPWYRQRSTVVGIALVIAAAIAALVFTNGRAANHSAPAAPPSQTIKQYITDNEISSTPVRLGDPGAPNIAIALPEGWSDMGEDTPPRAYGAVQLDNAEDPNDPPTIVVLLSKLSGDVDQAKILEYAPRELMNLPGYEPVADPISGELSGFDGVQLAGLYERDGEMRTIAQKTVVIPVNGAVYVLQLNADALKSDAPALMQATEVIDQQTKIKP